MPDLNFTQIAAKLPAGSVVDDAANNDVKISLKALMGEAVVTPADPKVGEAISKILNACASAQDTYNATAETDLNSYFTPAASAPILDTATGVFNSQFSYTVIVQIPLNTNEVNAITI